MRKLLALLLALTGVFALAACGGSDEEPADNNTNNNTDNTNDQQQDEEPAEENPYEDQVIKVYFVPSRPADEILEITEPLADLLMDDLADQGFEVGGVEILVSSTYEAAGEALLSGTGDIGFLPGGTYTAYKDIAGSPIEVLLAATRGGLTKDSAEAADWNDGLATDSDPEYQVAYYKGLIIAGPSTAGRALAQKVNDGAPLAWADVKDLNWCVRSATSSSGYIYPNVWLNETFGYTFDDIEGSVTQTSGYGDSAARLATETCDVATFYADARRDYADEWVGDYGRTQEIWAETDVVGVTDNIMNDTISASTVNLDDDLMAALKQAFLNLPNSDAGLEVMSVYSHQGYTEVSDSDYDAARAAAEIAGE